MRAPRGQVYGSNRLIQHCDQFRFISVSTSPFPPVSPWPVFLTNFHIGYSSSREYDRPDHSAKVGQEAKELLRVVGRGSPGASHSTNINVDALVEPHQLLRRKGNFSKVVGL